MAHRIQLTPFTCFAVSPGIDSCHPGAWRAPAPTPSPSSAVHRRRSTTLTPPRCSSGPIRALGKRPKSPLITCARPRRPWRALGAQASRSGELRGRRAALAVEGPVPSPAPPVRAHLWTTHATAVLHGRTPTQNEPRGAGFAHSGDRAAAEQSSGDPAPPPAPPTARGRPILNQRPRLDPEPICSKPSDPDPTAEIQPYPFGLSHLLKSPRLSLKSTRGPSV